MSSPSAFSMVLAMNELLENILSCIDSFYELVVPQRVCRKFRAAMHGSTTLRRKMGLAHHKRLIDSNAAGTEGHDSGSNQRWTPAETVSNPKEDPDVLDEVHPLIYPINKIQFEIFERDPQRLYEDCLDPVEGNTPAVDPLPESNADQGEMQFGKHGRRRAKGARVSLGFRLRFRFRPGLMARSLRCGRLGEPGFPRETTVHKGSWRDGRVALVRKPVEIAVCVIAPWTSCGGIGLEDQAFYWEARR